MTWRDDLFYIVTTEGNVLHISKTVIRHGSNPNYSICGTSRNGVRPTDTQLRTFDVCATCQHRLDQEEGKK